MQFQDKLRTSGIYALLALLIAGIYLLATLPSSTPSLTPSVASAPTSSSSESIEAEYRTGISRELRAMSEALANVSTTASSGTLRLGDLTVFRSAARTMRESTLRISKMTPPPSFASFHGQVLNASRVCRDGTAPMALWDTLPSQLDVLLAASDMEKCQAAFESIALP